MTIPRASHLGAEGAPRYRRGLLSRGAGGGRSFRAWQVVMPFMRGMPIARTGPSPPMAAHRRHFHLRAGCSLAGLLLVLERTRTMIDDLRAGGEVARGDQPTCVSNTLFCIGLLVVRKGACQGFPDGKAPIFTPGGAL